MCGDWGNRTSLVQRVVTFSLFRPRKVIVKKHRLRDTRRMTSLIISMICIVLGLAWQRSDRWLLNLDYIGPFLIGYLFNIYLWGSSHSGTHLCGRTFTSWSWGFSIWLLIGLRSPDLEDTLLSAFRLVLKAWSCRRRVWRVKLWNQLDSLIICKREGDSCNSRSMIRNSKCSWSRNHLRFIGHSIKTFHELALKCFWGLW
jgi:hypothetical protein